MSHSTRCAACKYLRRRCPKDCVLAPYFPPTNPQRFACVHKIFGASNTTKMLEQLPLHLRAVAADCMSFEASSRVEDPVYGSVRIISQLQEQIIEAQSELVKTKGEIDFHNAKQQLQQQQMQQLQMIHAIAQEGEDQPLWLSSCQQDPFPNVNQQLLEDYNYSNTFCGFEF
ncbi:LOB domain-containing protein 24-like [Quercus robur]|uniref:LOB domain-containing protein 24-like n=1 Tax=Quercus robur TaxID=38942 RepID=UPI0021636743|nr:LOB domain-containing protein 24-like [Quercus robur]